MVISVGGLLAAALQTFLTLRERPPEQERLSTERQVARAHARVLAESRIRIRKEVVQRELGASELVNPAWSTGAPEGAAPTVDGVAGLLATGRCTRILVVGVPGIGKSSFVTLVAHRLLDKGDADRAVPVVFDLSSWDAERFSLDDWLASTVREVYNLGNIGEFGETAAGRLLETGMVLPIIDGVDELSPLARSKVAEYVHEARSGYSVVATSCTPSSNA